MPETRLHIVIFSHGFGVRKEDRGLFTAIARALPDAKSVLFDYNPINEASNTLTAKPLDEQARKLRKVLNTTRAEYPDAIIDLVCHSQGCVVAALLKPRGIRKVILLTPPDDVSETTVAKQLGSRLDTVIDTTTRTRLARTDGSTTVIHPEYWQSLAGIDPVKLYNRLARVTVLRIISARQDEVLGNVRFEGVTKTNYSYPTERACPVSINKVELGVLYCLLTEEGAIEMIPSTRHRGCFVMM
jgi:pimeloyl-ACP methyl ester carboxylesterase